MPEPIRLRSNHPQTQRALRIASGAANWRELLMVDGSHAWAVPSESRPTLSFVVTSSACGCESYRRSAPALCKHIIAVRVHDAFRAAIDAGTDPQQAVVLA